MVNSNELQLLSKMFQDNGYPEEVVNRAVRNKIIQFRQDQAFGPKKRPIVMRLLYIGKPSVRFGKLITDSVSSCFGSVEVRCVYTTRTLRTNPVKDVLPTFSKSNVVYNYVCHCGSEYVGRMGASLLTRIGQHVPKKIRSLLAVNSSQPTNNSSGPSMRRSMRIKSLSKGPLAVTVGQPTPVTSESAIGEHLLKNDVCLKNYSDAKFSVLAQARSDYHLKILEAIFITSRKPVLCKQKKFVLPLKIFNRFYN